MTTADARILPLPNSRMKRVTLLPPPLLGMFQRCHHPGGGGKEAEEEEEEEEEAPLGPPAGCREASRRAAVASRPLGTPPPLVH